MLAATTPLAILVPYVLAILGGLIGAAGWLTGGYRKSVATARMADIEALDHRVQTLEAEKVIREAKVKAQDETIETLLDRVRGSDQLVKLTDQLAAFMLSCQRRDEHMIDVLERLAQK